MQDFMEINCFVTITKSIFATNNIFHYFVQLKYKGAFRTVDFDLSYDKYF